MSLWFRGARALAGSVLVLLLTAGSCGQLGDGPGLDDLLAFSCTAGDEPFFQFTSHPTHAITIVRPSDASTVSIGRVDVNAGGLTLGDRVYWDVQGGTSGYQDPPAGFEFLFEPNPTASGSDTQLSVLVYADTPLTGAAGVTVRVRGMSYDATDTTLHGECLRRLTIVVTSAG